MATNAAAWKKVGNIMGPPGHRSTVPGPPGPPGPGSPFLIISQADYDALDVVDPTMLYVITETEYVDHSVTYGAAPYGAGPYGGNH